MTHGRAARHRVFTFLSVPTDRTACFYALLADRTDGAAVYLKNATEGPIGRHTVNLLLALIGQVTQDLFPPTTCCCKGTPTPSGPFICG